MVRLALTLVAGLAVLPLGGCVKRTITITSTPEGALTYLNNREVGRTPVTVEFVHYGEYDVRLVMDGYEPLITSGMAKTPVWDMPGLDLVAEAVPGVANHIEWHYELVPVNNDPNALLDRARELRTRLEESPMPVDDDASDPEADAEGS